MYPIARRGGEWNRIKWGIYKKWKGLSVEITFVTVVGVIIISQPIIVVVIVIGNRVIKSHNENENNLGWEASLKWESEHWEITIIEEPNIRNNSKNS